jgi:tetratricopeptide (TPR) repeat protein
MGVTVGFLGVHSLDSYDVWTHLATGRLIVEERRIPDHEPYSYTQNRLMTLEEAAPHYTVRRTVLTPQPRIAVAAGVRFDDECKARLARARIPLEQVELKIEPPFKRLVRDAVDGAGRVVLAEGTPLKQRQIDELRSAGVNEVEVTVPWVNHEWLFQVPAYLSYKLAGLSGPILFKSAVVALAFLFLFLTVHRPETRVAGITAVFLAAIVSSKRFFMRPEVTSILFTAVWLYLLERLRRRPESWSICVTTPLLMIVWVNSHGYFILGPAIMLVYLVGEGLQSVVPMPRSLRGGPASGGGLMCWKEDLITGRGWRRLALATVLTAAATFVNPYGLEGARYPIDVLRQVADPTSVIRTVIGEMQPPLVFSFTHAISFMWILMAVSGASWVLNIRRLKLSRLILYVLSIMFLMKAFRNTPFFGVPAGVFLGLNVNEASPDTVRFLRDRIGGEVLLVMKWAGRMGLAVLLVFFILSMATDRFYIDDVATERFGFGYSTGKFSMGAAEFVRDNPVNGNLFNPFGMGGLCMWKLYPEKRPGPDGTPRDYYGGRRLFIDGRAEMYGGPFVRLYTEALTNRDVWRALSEKYNFQIVLLNTSAGDTHALIRMLYEDRSWVLCYGDGVGYVFVRDTAENRPIIDRARRAMESPRFVDFTDSYAPLASSLPFIPSRQEFVVSQDRIWSLARILSADPRLGDDARKVSASPSQVEFDRRLFRNGYDALRDRVPLLPERVILPGEMSGRWAFAAMTAHGQLADAILMGMIKLSPDVAEPYVSRGNTFLGRGVEMLKRGMEKEAKAELDMAIEYLRQAESLDPDYPGLLLYLLRTAEAMKDAKRADRYLRRAMRDLYPSPNVVAVVAQACIGRGRFGDALKLFNRALRAVPERESSGLEERIAYCYYGLRDLRNALVHALRSVDLDERHQGYWFTLGVIYRAQNRISDAKECFEKALELKSDFTEARDQLRQLEAGPVPRPPLPTIR